MLLMWNTDSFLNRAQELVKKAIEKHAKYTIAELDRSRPVKKGAATRRRLGEQVAVNMHTMGTSFVGKVRDVRHIAEAQIGEGVADMVEFEAQVNGHELTKRPTESKPGCSPTDSTGIGCPTLTGLLVKWAARARVRDCRMVAKDDRIQQVGSESKRCEEGPFLVFF